MKEKEYVFCKNCKNLFKPTISCIAGKAEVKRTWYDETLIYGIDPKDKNKNNGCKDFVAMNVEKEGMGLNKLNIIMSIITISAISFIIFSVIEIIRRSI